ncbi:MAG: hypothetical protein EXR08_00715 [Alphaproteobacteria bacterium]|nr:hypothetical protein [Alphaproteobacteria bacterium]
MDLLDEAIELLDHQVRYRLEGTAKAQVAVRLAVIQLLDKKPDKALELIAGQDVPEANLLRADIYWAAQDWPNAAASVDKVLTDGGAPAAGKEIDAATQGRVMRAAIAYALAGQQDGLDKLRGRYEAQMAATPFAGSFDVISRSSAHNGVAFRQLASTIAGLDTLKDFMASYRRDL